VFKFWVADWFALLNNKMGGDLNKIRTVGRYMIEVWKAAGMNMDNVEVGPACSCLPNMVTADPSLFQFLWASDEINKHSDEYWRRVMDIATKNSITRMQRCCTIMGRDVRERHLHALLCCFVLVRSRMFCCVSFA